MEPEEILSSSLETLYNFAPIAHSSAGGLFTYVHRSEDPNSPPLTITVSVPDTQTEHWSLHVSTIWTAALYVADHISELNLPPAPAESRSSSAADTHPLRLIELGAGTGLPSILIAKRYPHISVIASDFPDAKLIHTLRENVARNDARANCAVVPHAWGTDPSALLLHSSGAGADVVLAADTLWDPAQHAALLCTLCAVLARAFHRGPAHREIRARLVLSCGAGGGARACGGDGARGGAGGLGLGLGL
jgi:nicotinamide N-methyltransferase